MLAATAALKGVEAGKQYAAEITNSDQSRNQDLIAAGQLLMRVRMYPQAAELLSAGSQGQSGSQTNLAQINAFAKTKRREDLQFDDSDPSGVLKKMMVQWFSLDADVKAYVDLVSKNGLEGTREEMIDKSKKDLAKLRSMVLNTELPPDVFLDLIASNLNVTKEGNDEQGYRMAMKSVGGPTTYAYVVKEEGKYKVLASGGDLPDIGREVVERLRLGDGKSARVMLDFARDRQTLGGGDDTLEGKVFPRFWTKGLEGDEHNMRAAALALIVDDDSIKRYIAPLEQESAAAAEAQKTNFDLALAHAYNKLQRWKDLGTVAERLTKAAPTSATAFEFFEISCQMQQQWRACEAMVKARLARDAEDLPAQREAARNEIVQGEMDKAVEELRHIAGDSRATEADLNQFAWATLFVKSVPEDAIEAAQRANNLGKNSNYAVLHTLACVYAEIGKTTEARDLLIRALDSSQLSEPDSALWYGFGRVAESYGQYDAAIVAYRRVEVPKIPEPTSTFALSQMRLQGLAKQHPEVAKLMN
jgi:hypothetical protein